MNRAQRRLHLLIWIGAAAAMAALVVTGVLAKQRVAAERGAWAQQMEPR